MNETKLTEIESKLLNWVIDGRPAGGRPGGFAERVAARRSLEERGLILCGLATTAGRLAADRAETVIYIAGERVTLSYYDAQDTLLCARGVYLGSAPTQALTFEGKRFKVRMGRVRFDGSTDVTVVSIESLRPAPAGD